MSDSVPTEIPYRGFVIYLSEHLGTVEGYAIQIQAREVESVPPLAPGVRCPQTPKVFKSTYPHGYKIQTVAEHVIVAVREIVDQWFANAEDNNHG